MVRVALKVKILDVVIDNIRIDLYRVILIEIRG